MCTYTWVLALSMTYYTILIEIQNCMHNEQQAVQVQAVRSEVSLLIPTPVVHMYVYPTRVSLRSIYIYQTLFTVHTS